MSKNILDDARAYLVSSLRGKHNGFETKHPWRKDWEFAVLHSLHVESYALRILARENHSLSEHEVILLRLAAILHDIARLDKRENHAESGAEIAEKWLHDNSGYEPGSGNIERYGR
jgi:HD-GYP domain-containing protein (c-di-GMP phosphodiesterase class II)